ncbi:uncharacterized protein DUF1090 [Luteibacter sp. OK325]|jgi:hypothetical protein|uniref:DUF1090 domain-containing protein n=1 Tax=Luteibacter sp. OK325 TaxID=2135670 RepID=UPI000D35F5EA|nr:DUF1090 domain-containing protein [Luteibacter sp. OK325]PTR30786.1 uncharacterized protein DUF1090 [Luteibacter sp. OK325]
MKALPSIVLLSSFLMPTLAFAQSSGCDAKRESIQTEIAYAQSHGNASRVRGLQTALAEVTAHCTEESLQSAANKKVAKAREDVAENERDLQDAKDQGKSPKKIADRQRKLDDAHAGLEQALINAGR